MKRLPLTVAVAQPVCKPYDIPANSAYHAELVRSAQARVIVFPELSLTGYHYDAPVVDPGDSALSRLVAACVEAGCLALAGAPVTAAGGGKSIGLLAIDSAGVRIAYQKRFLGGEERRHFAAGTEASVIDIDGWRIGLAICKDTGIPQHDADLAELGIDVYVAAVLEHAEDAAITVQRAERIARTHHVWVAIASFAGSTGEGYHDSTGRSGIWRPDGTQAVRAGTEAGDCVSAVLR